jgi:ParB family transcriptional regulator, chromosome partitioning protein
MNKRTDSIRSIFSAPKLTEGVLSADNNAAPLPRISAGSVRSLRDTFSGVEKENVELRARLESGEVAFELDPNLIDPSPLADRFAEQDESSFEALKASIRERGQEIPILVRDHPEISGRYQSAYGHRRIRAARELGILIKAFVRVLSVEDLVIAQGLENSAREDLSFIERAVFALRLEDAGFERRVTQSALSVDRAEVSKLIAVAKAIPRDVIEGIGRAPAVGRGRWQLFAGAVKNSDALKRVRLGIQGPRLSGLPGEARFSILLSAANKSASAQTRRPAPILSPAGFEIARMAFTDTDLKLTMRRTDNEGFAEYLVGRIPELFEAYSKTIP